MQSFLDRVAEYITGNYTNKLSELCIVFPNRRAGLFFKTSLARLSDKPFWAPEIYSIEDFIAKISGIEIIDPIAQLFELYEAYKNVEKEKAEPFDTFSQWAQILLADFNEIDSGLVNAQNLFSNLKNIKELESWNVDTADLTTFQREYLHFWKSMGNYYNEFNRKLEKEKKAYQGLAYKLVTASTTEKINEFSWHKIIFAGFNALTAAEEKIIHNLLVAGKAETLWDADTYYLDNKIQEAGRFLRKHSIVDWNKMNPENKFHWVNNDLSVSSKKITVTGVSKNIGQARFAGQLVQELLDKNPTPNLTHTAIVLADENLLFPVLHSLPAAVQNVNVTMGYPLKNTPIAGFNELLFQLHENSNKLNKEGLFYHQDIINLLRHPYTKMLLDTKAEAITETIINYLHEKNSVFCSLKIIETINIKQSEALQILLSEWKNTSTVFSCLHQLINLLKLFFSTQKEKDEDDRKANFDLEYLFSYSKIITRLQSLSENYSSLTEIKMLRSLLLQLIRSTNLSFYGEPVTGLQIMGLLETRTLDFENIILLSANEGLLPAGKSQNSFIAHDIKRVFGLPTHVEKDSIFAYHFYRLLQRANNIHILYNTETDELGRGEKSRFVSQLLHEFTLINKTSTITEQLLETSISRSTLASEITIVKTPDILDKLSKKASDGFSPSLLNMFRNCPLKFYFHFIAGLRETDEVEEDIGADTLGNVIHQTLEELYRPLIGKTLSQIDLQGMKEIAEDKLKEKFKKYFPESDLNHGKNLLTLKVACKFISDFFTNEMDEVQHLTKRNRQLIIEQLEQEYTAEINVGNKTIKLKGKTDRVDTNGIVTRIIDYKTGRADDKELKIKNWDELKIDIKLNKSFQLLMYAWL
ncbi:MAG: PD-(D/E)XK nuclease family protein, partial [Bacteroidia bacterium]|nr:PD-(D/E)XK nuclease family protein [Bacteroidia bacterium]